MALLASENVISQFLEEFKCPICCQLLKEVVEFKCGHRFCRSCYETSILEKSNILCYVCQEPHGDGKHLTLFKNEFVDLLSSAIRDSGAVAPRIEPKPNGNVNTMLKSRPNKRKRKSNSDCIFDELISEQETKPLAITKSSVPRTYEKTSKKSGIQDNQDHDNNYDSDGEDFEPEKIKLSVLKWLESMNHSESESSVDNDESSNITTRQSVKKRSSSTRGTVKSRKGSTKLNLINKNKNHSPQKPKKSDNKLVQRSEEKEKHNETVMSLSSSGWQRIEKIQKSITSGKHKELRVVLQTHKDTSKESLNDNCSLLEHTSTKTSPCKQIEQSTKNLQSPSIPRRETINQREETVRSTSKQTDTNMDEDIFEIPTQKCIAEESDSFNTAEEDMDLIEDDNNIATINLILSKLEKSISYLDSKTVVSEALKNNLKSIIPFLNGLKIVKIVNPLSNKSLQVNLECDCMNTKVISVDRSVQTETQSPRESPKIDPLNTSYKKRILQEITDHNIGNKPVAKNNVPNNVKSRTVRLVKSSSPKKRVESNDDVFSSSFDHLDFETQDLLNKQNRNKTVMNKEQIIPDVTLIDATCKTSSGSVLLLSRNEFAENLMNKSLNSKLSELKKNYKRIRPVTSDSDSDDEKRKKPALKLNESLVSIQFDSNTERFHEDSFNDDIRKLPDSEEMMQACDELIANATKRVTKAQVHRERTPATSQNNVFTSDQLMNKNILSEINRNLDELENVIEREKMDKVQISQSLFSSSTHERINSDDVQISAFLDDDDKFEDAIGDVITPEKETSGSRNNITILQNVKLKSQDRVISSKENVDEDIIESTPEKNRSQPCTRMSQLFGNDISDTQLLEALPPPPGFEDDCDNDITLIDALTPPKSIGNLTGKRITNCKSMNDSERSIMETSTPHSHKFKHPRDMTLGLSPITLSSQRFDVNSCTPLKVSPLVVVPSTSNNCKSNMLSSTPKQKSLWNYVLPKSTNKIKSCVVACSRLDDMVLVNKFLSMKLGTFTQKFNKDVTHLIVNDNRGMAHTPKYVLAVASGIWVLSLNWIKECVERNTLVSEEPYEVLDPSGKPGPKTSRLYREKKPLLKGYAFYCAEPFVLMTKEDTELLITLAGGEVVGSLRELRAKKKSAICIVISQKANSEDIKFNDSCLQDYEVITVDLEWLSKSIGKYEVCSVRPYLLCSDDYIDSLGYPEELLIDEPYTETEDF